MMRRRIRNHSGRAGFTLLELLVVIGLIGVITTWGYVILFRINSEWNELRRRTDLSNAADVIFQSMRDDFNAVISPTLAGIALSADHGMHSDTERHRELFNDSFSFPVALSGVPGVSRVRYLVQRTPPRDFLTREVLPLSGESANPAITHLDERVDVVYLRCEVGTQVNGNFTWVSDGWHNGGVPEAVRVSMTLADPDNPWIQLSRKAVFDVRVQ